MVTQFIRGMLTNKTGILVTDNSIFDVGDL